MRFIFSLVIVFWRVFAGAQVNLDSGLVACYPLNGSAVDLATGYHGILSNAQAVLNKNSKPNSAIQFQGTINSMIELPGNSPLKNNVLSVSAWVKTGSSNSLSSYIVFTRNTGSSPSTNSEAYALCLNAASGGKKFRAIKGTATQTYWVDNTTTLLNNTWYHVCFTIDVSAVKMYVNGILEATVTATGNISYQTGKPVLLGGSNEFANPRPFDGALDNLRFYNRVLDSTEVITMYQNDPPCVPALAPPSANFAEGPTCFKQQGFLTDSSLNHPDAWHWTITGATLQNSFEPNPAITFTSLGTHTVQLIASNNLGSDTIQKTVTVHPIPNVQASISPTMVGANHQTTITASGASTYTWTYQNFDLYGQVLNFAFTGTGNAQLYLVGRDSLGCLGYDTLRIKIYLIEGLAKHTGSDAYIEVFPNPLENILHLTNHSEENTQIVLFDAMGKIILKINLESGQNSEIDTSTWLPGIYFLQTESKRGLIKQRLVKPF